MANSIDQLQIDIVAQDKASDTIEALSQSIRGLGEALDKLNTRKLKKMVDTVEGLNINVNMSGVTKAIDNIGDSASESVKQVDALANKLEDVQKTLNGASFSKKVIFGKDANMGNLEPTQLGFTSDIPVMSAMERLKQEFTDSLSGFQTFDFDFSKGFQQTTHKINNELNPALEEVQEHVEELSGVAKGTNPLNSFVEKAKNAFDSLKQKIMEASGAIGGKKWAIPDIEESIQKAREFKKIISEMESNKIPFNEDAYKEAIVGYEKATKAVKEYKNAIIKSGDENRNALPSFVVLAEYTKQFSNKLGELSGKLMNVIPKLIAPLRLASKEYIEKCENMVQAVKNLQKRVQAHLAKMSAFWKRTMKTFTFMLVRKAITAIIKEVATAVQSLAMFSNAMSTQFNKSISILVADFQYLGRSIVSVFAPLIDAIAPVIDAIVDKIAYLLSYVGMLMSALTGADTFTKAKKTVNNYADSLDNASKSAKKLTMGIDELNILNEQTNSKSNTYDGWEDAWEQVDVPDSIKNIADKLKSVWDSITEPFERAWEKAKETVLTSWNAMISSLKTMLSSVGDAFLKVWNQEETVKVFEHILNAIGNIMLAIDNLADRFRLAWDEAGRGEKVFEGIRDIIGVLAQHFDDFTASLFFWSGSIDFAPLLDSINELLESLKELADFIGGLFEDVMNNVVLKYIKFLIEEGLPHLNETIKSIIDAFDFEKIREDLKPLEEAFERLLENIDKGKTNALGNLGKAIADFTNGEEFTKFTQRIADIMDLISAEDVEKVLTGIGKGILNIAEAIVKFVNSDAFMAFLEAIDKWLENTSDDDIAGILEKIAIAIALFKFGEFATSGISGFFKFLSMVTAAKNLGTIADALGKMAGSTTTIGAVLTKLGGITLIITGVITTITSFFKMWNDGWSVAGEIVKDIGIALVAAGAIMLGVAAFPAVIVAAIVAALTTIAILIHEHWDEIKAFITETIPTWWNEKALPWIKNIPNKIGETLVNLWGKIVEWGNNVKDSIGQWLEDLKENMKEKVSTAIDNTVTFFEELPRKIGYALGFALRTIIQWGVNVINWIKTNIPLYIKAIIEFFATLPGRIWEQLKLVLTKIVEWGKSVLSWISENVPKMIKNIVDFFAKLPGEIFKWLGKIIDKFNNWKTNTMSWIKVNVKAIVDSIVNFFKELPSRIYKIGKSIVSNLIDGVKDAWDSLKSGFEDFVGGFLDGFSGANGNFSFSLNSANEFASGGFPSYGSLFVAGEPGARTEWVGNIGGRTGVVSNGEITGIEEAVYATGNTETQLLSQLIQVSRQILDKDPVVLGDRDIAMMSNRGQSKLGMNIIT